MKKIRPVVQDFHEVVENRLLTASAGAFFVRDEFVFFECIDTSVLSDSIVFFVLMDLSD